MRKTFKDITGLRFGKLTVISWEKRGSHYYWKCVCDCGNETTVYGGSLRCGITKSCGCYLVEKNTLVNTTHGRSNTPEFVSWYGMHKRTKQKTNPSYKRYSTMHITVCKRWTGPKGFANFLSDMGEKPSRKHSIDRIDNYKGYFPKNCRWATQSEQNRNQQQSIFITYKGKKIHYCDFADMYGLSYSLLYRKAKSGHTGEMILDSMR